MNASAGVIVLDPRGFVTTTSTVCGAIAPGLDAVIVVPALFTVNCAAVGPKSTPVELKSVKLDPVITTVVPPLSGPELGETPLTTGPADKTPLS